MNYLYVENLAKHYGERVLFEDLTFGLNKGEKVALIADNGAGKTSLLKIIAGKDTADGGEVTLSKEIRVSFLEQDPVFDDEKSINDLIQGSNSEVLSVIRDYEKALADQTADFNEATQKAFELASVKMDTHKAWDYERRVKEMLTRFNILDLDQKIGVLSGGQKKRLALALVLLDDPEFLILDEPTNHLDIEMIEWLEKYLQQSAITLLMVTHDRYFLDRICNHILELSDGKLHRHKGNYLYFLEKKAERERNLQAETDKAGKLLKRELEWMRRMPKARTTKSKARINAFYETEEKAGNKKSNQELKLEVKMSRMGGKILELKKVYKSYGDIKILDGFDYTFKKGERIGILGKNGTGKTSFLEIVTGKENPDSGKVNVGETIVYGYYSQKGIEIKEDKRIIDVVKEIAEVITMGDGSKLTASQFLQHFLFPPGMQYTQVSRLSGGERKRLYLMTVLIKNPNFLILDEPTNDLDLLTLNRLEEFLSGFGGCLIVVSHDRYFMDKLVDHLFIFEGDGKIRDFNGTYSEYRQDEEEKERQEKEQKATLKKEGEKMQNSNQAEEKRKLSYKEKREYENLEKEIDDLEKEKKELESAMNSGDQHYEELQKVSLRLEEVLKLIDSKTLRWMELSEYVS